MVSMQRINPLTDGAWDKASGRGAAAYELEVQRKVCFRFLFATLHQLLWWRLEQGCCFWNGLLVGESLIFVINTDSLVLVQGLLNPSLSMALCDFRLLCASFHVKVSRLIAKAAHDRAKEALK